MKARRTNWRDGPVVWFLIGLSGIASIALNAFAFFATLQTAAAGEYIDYATGRLRVIDTLETLSVGVTCLWFILGFIALAAYQMARAAMAFFSQR